MWLHQKCNKQLKPEIVTVSADCYLYLYEHHTLSTLVVVVADTEGGDYSDAE